MAETIDLGGILVEVVKKDIKNIHLSVYPPIGKVLIAAPLRMSLDTIRIFAISKLGWIKQQQKKLNEQERETSREYIDRESHYVWGKRYLLKVVEHDALPKVELKHGTMLLRVRPETNEAKKQAIVAEWYRDQLKKAAAPLLTKWEPLLGVRVERFFVQRMKTQWGSCSASTKGIRLNSELAKKPPICLEYIIVHEMVHLIERRHNERFTALMDKYMPLWRHYRDILNTTLLGYEEWKYEFVGP
jgi:predicted metal-dependent hydrolase